MTHLPLSPSVVELDGPFEHEFFHTRGLRLHAATAGDKSDPLVVLIHGSFGGWFDFQKVIAPLAQRGFHVAAVDMRGFGMSDKPPVEAGQDIRTAVGDIFGLIQAMGHSSAFLVGADSGGAVAWALSASHPERIRGLVSISSAHPVDLRRAVAARPWDFGWVSLRAFLCRLPKTLVRRNPLLSVAAYRRDLDLNVSMHFPESEKEKIFSLRVQASRIGNVRRGILWNHRLRTAVVPFGWVETAVTRPVLFVHADQKLWRPVIKRATKRVRGTFTASTIPDSKNLPHVENPVTFAQTIASWMGRI